jgi:hypothetical protein
VTGEIYRLRDNALRLLDRLEDYPRLADRRLIPTRFGRAWVYLYRGSVQGRIPVGSGDWRDLSRHGPRVRAAAVRRQRDPKNPSHRRQLRSAEPE